MADDNLPLWNPDGLGLLGDNRPLGEAAEPARGMPGNDVADTPIIQPGPLNGAVPQDGSGAGGGTLTDIIIVFNGTANYCDIKGKITGPV